MNVLFLAPGFPYEMPHFCRGLARVGARVIGLGDQPAGLLPEPARSSLSHYLDVAGLWSAEDAVERVLHQAGSLTIDRVECLWEPGMLLAARLREALGVPGMSYRQTLLFRDKEQMKRALDEAGIRTPRHWRATTADGCREGAEQIGFPLIVKPVAGAGSADTYRIEDAGELEKVLPRLRHVDEISVEEYVAGEEYTFDTVSIGGEPAYFNLAWYRPKPLVGRSLEWISPQTVTLREVDAERLEPGRDMGLAVLRALGFSTGFSHMEWFLTPAGEAVFGEIGARPPGARSVEIMNYGCDIDLYTGWAEAVVHGRFSQRVRRPYNCAVIFKRAQGEGRIRHIEGLDSLLYRYGRHIVHIDLLPLGQPRRNWKQTLVSDGYVVLRHPDLATTLEMADRVGTDLRLYAG